MRYRRISIDGGNCHLEMRRLDAVEDLGPSDAVERFQKLPNMPRTTS